MTKTIDGRPVVPGAGRLRPLGIDEVESTGGFWADRQRVNSEATIAHCHDCSSIGGATRLWPTSTWGRSYFQDDVPIREREAFFGHAVRALYLAASAVDIAVETGDEALLVTIVGQWEGSIARRTYLTGGMGSHHDGEAFGEDFVLPPDQALIGDLRGRCLVDAGVATPIGDGGCTIRRSNRKDAVQRSDDVSRAGWSIVLLRQTRSMDLPAPGDEIAIPLTPYHTWANRGPVDYAGLDPDNLTEVDCLIRVAGSRPVEGAARPDIDTKRTTSLGDAPCPTNGKNERGFLLGGSFASRGSRTVACTA